MRTSAARASARRLGSNGSSALTRSLDRVRLAIAAAPTWALSLAALLPPLIAGACLAVTLRSAQDLERRWAELQPSLTTLRARAAEPAPAPPEPFPAKLPTSQSASRVVSHLHEAARAQSVVVANVATQQQAATDKTLGRLHVDITLRGRYDAIKRVLIDVVGRDSQQAVLQQLNLRRVNGGEVEARVLATWLSRPLSPNTTR